MRRLENPIPRTGLPTFHEASPQRSFRDSDAVGRAWQKARVNTAQLFALAESTRQIQQELDRLRLRKGDAATLGWKWLTPYKELDPTKSVGKDTVVYISPLNPIATTGLTDLDTNTTLLAPPGIWVALLSIPKKTGDGHYNVPKDPIPNSGTVIPSGTPLKGDLEATSPKIYWLLIRGVSSCPYA